jgi:plastocyanin
MFRYAVITSVVALSTLALLSGCGSNSSPSSPSNPSMTAAVSIPVGARSLGLAGYAPNPVTVAAGTTIKWTNADSIAHTVTSDTGLFDSGTVAAGATFSTTVQSRGTLTYHCTFHQGMVGTIIVQ